MGLLAFILFTDFQCRSSFAVMTLAARDGILIAGVGAATTDMACWTIVIVLTSPVGPSAAVMPTIASLGSTEVEHTLGTANSRIWTGEALANVRAAGVGGKGPRRT